MSATVVCISRTLGAGGERIGRAIAEKLRFDYVDEEIITAASEKARVDPTLVADVENRQPIVQRVLESLAVLPRAKSQSAGKLPASAATAASPRERYRALIREAIAEIAGAGRVVIVAHAASMMLAGSPGVLRVLVTASSGKRAGRLSAADPRLTARRAATAITNSDHERREYLREFYNVREELPTHYDLVINTDVLSPEQTVTLIVGVARDWPRT